MMTTTARCAAATSASARRSAFLGGRTLVAASARPAPPARSSRGAPVRVVSDVRKDWKSSKSMTLTISDEDATHTFESYISDGERIISVTFPDQARRRKLSDTTWEVQLLPFSFMQWRATVFCTLRLEPVSGELRLSAEDLRIDGLPPELGVDGKVWLTMDGALKPARTAPAGRRKVLGKITVNLAADVNDAVAMFPGLDDAVNLINDTVISNLQGSINATIAKDYAKWKVAQRVPA